MARMYSRKKGKSGSKQPVRKVKPAWLSYEKKELELLVAKLAKDGLNSAQIGLSLRDSYGVPDVKLITKKSITSILEENKLAPAIPDDLLALLKKIILINKHRVRNKKDQPAKRGLELTNSKIRRLTKYYKRTGKLAKDWTYDPEKIRLMIE